MLPKEPSIAVSFLNLKLRDYDVTLEEICEEEDTSVETLLAELEAAGYRYDEDRRCFR